MRVLVTGGYAFKNWTKAVYSFDYWSARVGIDTVIHDGRIGVEQSRTKAWEDRERWGPAYFAQRWAEMRRVRVIEEKVDDVELKKLGPAAVITTVRRAIIRHKPEMALAFPGGAEVEAVLQECRKQGVRVVEVA